MKYRRVRLESLACTLPEEVVATAQIEQRLAPLYERLKLPQGRLELMSGIRERRFYPPGTRPSDISIITARKAIAASGVPAAEFGALLHGSVCRDFLEPATACRVHHHVGLPQSAIVYDVSNACLGILNGAVQLANMIELGQIRAGIVVGTECGRNLVENTIDRLNADESLSRNAIKNSVASLTIGSASAAMVLVDEELSRDGTRLTAAAMRCDTTHHELCQSEGLQQVMHTDSERLMREGVATGRATFADFLEEAQWRPEQLAKTVCHQVGAAHRKMMLESLGLSPANDYATLEWLGNTGSAAAPATAALAAKDGWFRKDDRVGLLGIGSGINCLMLGLQWGDTRIAA